MSGLRLLDRHLMVLSGSLRTLLSRARDRRRCADATYGWLFQPYLGEESVAVACFVSSNSPSPLISLAAVILDQQQVHTSRAFVMTLGDVEQVDNKALRRHQLLYQTGDVMSPTAHNVSALVEFMGNRPIIGWQLDKRIGLLNGVIKSTLGFALPNAQVDVAKLHQRKLRRGHAELTAATSVSAALACWKVPSVAMQTALDAATASALLYMRLQRIE